jgi:hypothetical protein
MKNKFLIFLVLTALPLSLLFTSCFTETIDALSTTSFQLPLIFHSNWVNKAAPDTSWDFTNLNKYQEYRDNREKIKKSILYQMNYWIDSLVYKDASGNPRPFDPADPNMPDIEFEAIRFYLRFADYVGGGDIESDFNPGNYRPSTIDPTNYLLGEFTNVNAKPYYRQAYHIISISDEVAQIISEAAKSKPAFYILSEYSKMKDQNINTEPKRYFPYIAARFDVMVKFEVDM